MFWAVGLSLAQDLPDDVPYDFSLGQDLAYDVEATLGLERVYVSEVDWFYASPVDTPATMTTGSITWQYGQSAEHRSLASTACMPTHATAGDSAASAGQTHLFEAYVQGFCGMDTP